MKADRVGLDTGAFALHFGNDPQIRETMTAIHPAEEILTREAASLKCRYRGKISIVDSYILAVSKEHNCRLITTDPILRELNIVPITHLKVP